ncbi:LysM peptidoglycan-binding domain-containing protein [Echinicola jeungdonensis]|uniref:LysM peptidoglycan-binding domain-containing protein n=1 Tax=Echinicola jeungdonensis TaxID=709343 RepID=A0ABV5J844_9BACT|nr:LysM peptidoglycan-binding domain-containing protein [Echinicola jeungdonensis]MDN3669938.1 LysM peptidoglycan-binding domain-containing protein [Echinicola jeungdonensis]
MRFQKFSLPFLIFSFFAFKIFAQAPKVPETISFANMTLHLDSRAQRDIQLDVNALHRNPRYFNQKMERVNLYMPIIERVLQEQGAPDDLKYLVIQESGLIPDAVSSSNAVGFWQFKKGTAEEVFLQVDHQIDERKNIVASTRGAALYLKKNNSRFDNWVCAVVAYQMGPGGAQGYFGNRYNGDRKMKITKNTHWYFKKYLAHKIAFQDHIGTLVSNQYLKEVKVQGPTSLKKLARDLNVSESHLETYNKWVSHGKIPGDKPYSLTYLEEDTTPDRPVLVSFPEEPSMQSPEVVKNHEGFPKITGNKAFSHLPEMIKINGIKGILVTQTMSQEAFTEKVGIREGKFRRVNDLKKSDKVIGGRYYYTKRKKSKAKVAEHVVKKGETLWQISQAYGIRLHSLMAKNIIYRDKDLKPGMVLKLQEYRRRNEGFEFVQVSPAKTTSYPIPTPTKPANYNNPPTTTQTHIVSRGETLYAIAKQYEVSVKNIQQWNNMGNQTTIHVGQKLIIQDQ